MTDDKNAFENLPGLKETIARIARVPSPSSKSSTELTYRVSDESNKITYKIISSRPLTAADIRRALAKAFSRTDVWPDDAGEVKIRI